MCLFHRLEVFAEDVFHELVNKEFVRGGFAAHHETGDGFVPREPSRPPPPFPDDDPVHGLALVPADPDRLELAPRLEACGEPVQGSGVESVRGWFGSGAIRSALDEAGPIELRPRPSNWRGVPSAWAGIGLRPPRRAS